MNGDYLLGKIKEEGFYFAGEHRGYKYRIIRRTREGLDFKKLENNKGLLINLNGYVLVPNSSKYFGVSYEDIPVDCHGGLTYANEELYMQPEVGWWIGFDTGHYGDVTLLIDDDGFYSLEGNTYRDMDYVKSQCKKIIDQIIEF